MNDAEPAVARSDFPLGSEKIWVYTPNAKYSKVAKVPVFKAEFIRKALGHTPAFPTRNATGKDVTCRLRLARRGLDENCESYQHRRESRQPLRLPATQWQKLSVAPTDDAV